MTLAIDPISGMSVDPDYCRRKAGGRAGDLLCLQPALSRPIWNRWKRAEQKPTG